MTASADDALLRKTGEEVTAVLVHVKKLLRIRNQLCSPLLWLPTETIIRILSLVMAETGSLYVGMSISGICHRFHEIMRHAAEIWWRVDFSSTREAQFMLSRSGGDPQAIRLDYRGMFHGRAVERVLGNWKDKLGFKGHRLDTLEFCGPQSAFSHFSWILERPLPRVKSLKIHIGELIGDELVENPQDPVHLELPDMPLQVLDLRNVTLSWSSQPHLFNGLRELYLNFRDCDYIVTIPEDELFDILDASPRLENLSLLQVGHEIQLMGDMGDIPLPSKRILQFPNLVSLSLENDPMIVKHTLECMDLPVIGSLKIRSFVSAIAAQAAPSLFFPDDRLPMRLFPNPSKFVVTPIGEQPETSIRAEIGSVTLQLDFAFDEGELGRCLFMPCIPQLVPPSVITLKLEYTNMEERGWRDFFASHPEVRFIECTEFCGISVSNSLWNALAPLGGENAEVPCPKLESIFILTYTDEVSFTSLRDCLRNRQIAGFTLKRLKLLDDHALMLDMDMDRFREEFNPLVGTVEAGNRYRSKRRVSPVLIVSWSMC